MQSHSSLNNNRNTKNARNGTSRKVFVFVFGVFVGIILTNFFSQQPLLSEFQRSHLEHRQGYQGEGQQKQQLRCDVEEPSFYELGRETETDKVMGVPSLPSCLEDDSTCTRPSCEREKCRPYGHFFHTMYQQKLSTFLNPDESFQMLEIGYIRIYLV
jgi:hypothetical protein